MIYDQVAKKYLEAARMIVREAEDEGCKGEEFDALVRCLIEAETMVQKHRDADELIKAITSSQLIERMTNHLTAAMEEKYKH